MDDLSLEAIKASQGKAYLGLSRISLIIMEQDGSTKGTANQPAAQ